MLKHKVTDILVNLLTETKEDDYFRHIEKINHLFLYVKNDLPAVFELSQKLCDEFLQGNQKTILTQKEKNISVEEYHRTKNAIAETETVNGKKIIKNYVVEKTKTLTPTEYEKMKAAVWSELDKCYYAFFEQEHDLSLGEYNEAVKAIVQPDGNYITSQLTEMDAEMHDAIAGSGEVVPQDNGLNIVQYKLPNRDNKITQAAWLVISQAEKKHKDMVDENGEAVYETNADGSPVYETDVNGNPIQATHDDGTFVFDDDGEPVYVRKIKQVIFYVGENGTEYSQEEYNRYINFVPLYTDENDPDKITHRAELTYETKTIPEDFFNEVKKAKAKTRKIEDRHGNMVDETYYVFRDPTIEQKHMSKEEHDLRVNALPSNEDSQKYIIKKITKTRVEKKEYDALPSAIALMDGISGEPLSYQIKFPSETKKISEKEYNYIVSSEPIYLHEYYYKYFRPFYGFTNWIKTDKNTYDNLDPAKYPLLQKKTTKPKILYYKYQYTEKKTIDKKLSKPQRRHLAWEILHNNKDFFAQVLGTTVDELNGITLKEIAQNYMFARWSPAVASRRKRRTQKQTFKKQLTQLQFKRQQNDGEFYTVYYYRAKKIKVCSVKYWRVNSYAGLYKFDHQYYEEKYVGKAWWHQSCAGQGKGDVSCGWVTRKTRRRCCNIITHAIYKKTTKGMTDYACKDDSFWTVEMQQLACTYYRDQYYNYFNFCHLHDGKYIPQKVVRQKALNNRPEEFLWNERRNTLLVPAPNGLEPSHKIYNDEYFMGKIYDDDPLRPPNFPKTGCESLNLCEKGRNKVFEDGQYYTEKTKFRDPNLQVRIHNHPPLETLEVPAALTQQPRGCWDR